MKHTTWIWFGVIWGLVHSSLALANRPDKPLTSGDAVLTPDPRPLTPVVTVDEAVRMALDASPILRSARRAVDAQEAIVSQARSGYYPRLATQTRYTWQSEVDPFLITVPAAGPGLPRSIQVSPVVTNTYGVRAQVQQAVFTAGRIGHRVEAARSQTDATRARYDQTKSDFVFRVRQVYWEGVRAAELLRLAEDGLRRVEAHRKDLEHLRSVGMAVDRDLLQATVQEEETRLQAVRVEERRDLALIELRSLLGLPLDREVVLSDPPVPVEGPAGTVDEFVRQAIAQRPDLTGVRAQVEGARSTIRTARSEWFPQVSLLLNTDYARPNVRFVPLKDTWRRSWEAGVMFNWDVYDGGYRSARSAEAQARLDAAEAQAEETVRQVTLDVHRAVREVALSFQSWNVARTRVASAEESARVTRAQFVQGLALSADVLDAENRLLAARTDQASSGIDWMMATAALDRAVGR
ncbi:MAG: TolC family protein [Candidatus Latescibacteria bacterium]|nr:TolC family protein [Candidatus Latescibacterota bacterium]